MPKSATRKKAVAPAPARAPGLAVEYWPIERLVPYTNNARTHSDAQVAEIAASMERFGWTVPILVAEDGTVVAGHGRLLAAQLAKAKEVPVLVARGWTQAQRRAYTIADNKIAEKAGWDDALLALELSELMALDIDVTSTGFNAGEIDRLISKRSAGLSDSEDAPELPVTPVTQPGDLWVLGRHRILCGDSTATDAVHKLLNGTAPKLMVTDPPYGVGYDANWRNDALQAGNSVRGAPGGRAVGKVENDDRADWSEAWKLFPGDVAYVWHGGTLSHVVAQSLIGSGFDIRSQIIWAKNQLVIGRGNYHPQHEPCWYAVRKGKKGHFNAGDRTQTTLWNIDKPHKSETGHSTQKPVECMLRPIENNSVKGDAIYEPFLGSGTTIIACEQSERVCYAMELSPAYVDVAVRRWQSFTGNAALLEGTNNSFATVAAERGVTTETEPQSFLPVEA